MKFEVLKEAEALLQGVLVSCRRIVKNNPLKRRKEVPCLIISMASAKCFSYFRSDSTLRGIFHQRLDCFHAQLSVELDLDGRDLRASTIYGHSDKTSTSNTGQKANPYLRPWPKLKRTPVVSNTSFFFTPGVGLLKNRSLKVMCKASHFASSVVRVLSN